MVCIMQYLPSYVAGHSILRGIRKSISTSIEMDVIYALPVMRYSLLIVFDQRLQLGVMGGERTDIINVLWKYIKYWNNIKFSHILMEFFYQLEQTILSSEFNFIYIFRNFYIVCKSKWNISTRNISTLNNILTIFNEKMPTLPSISF